MTDDVWTFVCGSCWEDFEVARSVVDYLASTPEHGPIRCTECGSYPVWREDTIRGNQIRMARAMEPVAEAAREAQRKMLEGFREAARRAGEDG